MEIIDESHVSVDGKVYKVDLTSMSDQPVYSLLLDGLSYEALVSPSDEVWQVLIKGELYSVQVEDERERRLRAAGGAQIGENREFHLKAPMPGLVISVPVEEGQEVEQGDVLVILESMKMQNELRSPRAGKVTRVKVAEGATVDQKETLLSVE
ncbi:MAG: biotin/lipoyl-containing protein [Anaerolineales bacterium]|nr:biotin/lipoyl-containing protein [Anaerolineales bacterium]